MADGVEEWEGSTVGRALPRSTGTIFIDDGDRAFLYRVVAIHALAGIEPERSLSAVAEALAEGGGEDGPPTPVALRRADGAQRLRQGLVGGGDGLTLDRRIQEAGFKLGALERACLRVPPSALARPGFVPGLFGSLADLFQQDRRK